MASSSSTDPRIKALLGTDRQKKPLVTHRPPTKPPRTAGGSWKKAPKRG